jgi:TolB-like protein
MSEGARRGSSWATAGKPAEGEHPDSPKIAVASFYRYTGDSEWWMFHDGRRHAGLAWWC